MKSILFLVTCGLLLRFFGAILKRWTPLPYEMAGWFLMGFGGWLVTSAAGAWTPFWCMLIPAAVSAALQRWNNPRWIHPAGDAAIVFVTAAASNPPLSVPVTLLVAVVMVMLGFAADRLAQFPFRRGHIFVGAFLIGAGAIAADTPRQLLNYLRENPRRWPQLAITPLPRAERLVLKTGQVAWVDVPTGKIRAGALFFHGYHFQGANQPAALAIRRALLQQGFLVLSLDHLGAGDSPSPARDAELKEWDPLPSELAAYDALRERLGSDAIFIVGHSMGTGAVARMLATDRPARGAAMLGAGFTDGKPVDGGYWYKRFKALYPFKPSISEERFGEIARAYHDKRKFVLAIPPTHAPLLFVTYLHENHDLAKTRDEFYDLIQGPKSKAMCDSSHYMYAERIGALLVGNPKPVNRMAKIFAANFDVNAPAVAGKAVGVKKP